MKKKPIMLLAAFMLALNVGAQTRVIAHRGYWDKEGAAQNSRASLQNALELNIYGSETDIWITADGHLMVNHDPSFGGVTIQTSTYAQCKKLVLANGERMPELKTFLKMMRKTKSSTKLIIEIKKHAERNANLAAAQAAVKAVESVPMKCTRNPLVNWESRIRTISFLQKSRQEEISTGISTRIPINWRIICTFGRTPYSIFTILT